MLIRRLFTKMRYNFSIKNDLLSHLDSTVKQIIKTQVDFHLDDFDSTNRFEDLNIDIFEKTRIIVEIEEFFKVDFKDEEFLGVQTPFDAVLLINKYISKDYSLKNLDENSVVRD